MLPGYAQLFDLPAVFLIGGVSANLHLIHHPAATDLSCDWAQLTLPPVKMICHLKLDSYRL